ncbi:MAG: carbohydrate binding family 9 domain-containing protein [Melioribacteraceae bacterium]|nr:carbohydrate binding family 9 domain-containing protein [Melioribacteraceae bacterium]
MKNFLLLIFISVSFLYAGNNPNAEKVLKLKLTSEKINIDGFIDDTWSNADSTTDFFQQAPYFNQPISRKTTAKILTTENAIYCMIISYDERENIQNFTGKLDDFNGDVVSFMIDTFGDQKSAYKFAVSASGVKADCRLIDDARNRDYSWDGIWFAASKIYDWGFVVEMEIPYKSIQYNNDLNQWGLDFDRYRPLNKEDQYWCEYEKSEGQRISKFGKLLLGDFKPTIEGLNLEIYPVGLSKATYKEDGKYDIEPQVGLDIFYNPSAQLTLNATINPDFAQIEADPFQFNISRYETFFNERRPFFVQGNEIFMPAGKQRNTGFYKPMDLFYSRRIGKKLPDGTEVPLTFGAKASGRIDDWEYGGFAAHTAETQYMDNDQKMIEKAAVFTSARVKKNIFENSTIGVLFVGKQTEGNTSGVIDIDGAFRQPDYQLAYQIARSINNSKGDFAGSYGYTFFNNNFMLYSRGRYIGNDFDINSVGFVPWKGTAEMVTLAGPVWLPDEGAISQILIYGGVLIGYEKADDFTDYGGLFGYNMQFRSGWGFELNADYSKARDVGKDYNAYSINLSSWYNISPDWSANLYGGYQKTYNFSRDYLANYSWLGAEIDWKAHKTFEIGTSFDMFIENNPDGNIEDITYNARPYIDLTPINDLSVRVYVDNLFVRSTDRMEQIIAGLLFSYNFSPKSWIYFAINEIQQRNDKHKMVTAERAAVLKVKYLYYF